MLSYSDIQALILEDEIQEQIEKEQYEETKLDNQLENGHDYKLIYNRDGTRKILSHALRNVERRLIIVCPWLSITGINDFLLDWCDAIVRHTNTTIEIGFGSLNDFSRHINFSELTVEDIIKIFKCRQDSWKYNALNKLYYMMCDYPDKLKLNILGTHEKYLICDDKFVFITSHNLLTSDEKSNQKEIGIYIRDKHIIKQLTSHFDESLSK